VRYDSGQFGSFEGRDNRRELLILLGRLGKGLPEQQANEVRAAFLHGLMGGTVSDFFAGRPLLVSPCSAVEAYHLLVAITGVLGVNIEDAARSLEDIVRQQ
jgi:hypothetical protein